MSATIESTENLLATLRTRHGYSQEELAATAGLSAQTVRNLEHGRQRPHRATATVLAHVLGCEPEDLRRPAHA
jgi:DNA-binding XRE family transcriptional regulator